MVFYHGNRKVAKAVPSLPFPSAFTSGNSPLTPKPFIKVLTQQTYMNCLLGNQGVSCSWLNWGECEGPRRTSRKDERWRELQRTKARVCRGRTLVRDQEIARVPIRKFSHFGPEISHRKTSLPAKQQPGCAACNLTPQSCSSWEPQPGSPLQPSKTALTCMGETASLHSSR